MFGRRKKPPSGEAGRVQVEVALESDLAQVENSVAEYLKNPTAAARQSLLGALEVLDDQAGQSDAYEGSVIGSGAVGYASKGEVLGETSIDPLVDEIPSSELHAQVTLVTAAKNEVRGPTPSTLAALRAASVTLAAAREERAADH
jgi:hypothetical protein